MMKKLRLGHVLFLVFLFSVSQSLRVCEPAPADSRRVLSAVVYPFIPDHTAYFYKIKCSFEKLHPDIRLDIVDLSDNYYDSTQPNALSNTSADVLEMDAVFLSDMAAGGKIQPLPAVLVPPAGRFMPVGSQASSFKGKIFGVPHWLCSDFLFSVKGDQIENCKSLSDLEKAIGAQHAPGHGLLIDLKGKSTLGELYLNALLDHYGSLEKAAPYLSPNNLDPESVEALKRVRALSDQDFGRNKSYHNADGFYGRQFARGRGRGLMGYTESMNSVFDEITNSCTSKEAIDPASVTAIPMPFSDKGSVPFAWVDTLTIASQCKGQKLKDAMAFIQFLASEPEVQSALEHSDGDFTPRYLSPALTKFFQDKSWLAKYPLYQKEGETFQRAIPIQRMGICDQLRQIGDKLDKSVLGP